MRDTERDARVATITECIKALLPEWEALTVRVDKLKKQRDVLSRELDQLLAEARSLGVLK